MDYLVCYQEILREIKAREDLRILKRTEIENHVFQFKLFL